jgi:Acyl-CoA reductase (LuxC)
MSPVPDAVRIDRVRRFVEAVARGGRDRPRHLAAIARETGLSLEGVELALSRYLEADAGGDEIGRLMERAGRAPAVLVILSANVFTGALRALALACACAPEVVVRPSRRESTFARALVEAADDAALRLAADVDVGGWPRGEVHVYGRDETLSVLRRRAATGVVVRGYGSGISVGVVSPGADLAEAARGFAEDVVVFDQRGCLSPRIGLVQGGEDRTRAFGEELHAALERAAASTPRGVLADDERSLARRYEETVGFAGCLWSAPDHIVGAARIGSPLLLPPTGRHVHLAACSDVEAMRGLLAPFESQLVALGSDDPGRYAVLAHRARLSRLGEMQRPPLDGPVDLRG